MAEENNFSCDLRYLLCRFW